MGKRGCNRRKYEKNPKVRSSQKRVISTSNRLTNLPQFAWDFPGFSNPMPQEMCQSFNPGQTLPRVHNGLGTGKKDGSRTNIQKELYSC